MALSMQQAIELLPAPSVLLAQLHQQVWWRHGVCLRAKQYLGDQTWRLVMTYAGHEYAVVYDALNGQCDWIEPLESD